MQIQTQATLKRENTYLDIEILSIIPISFVMFVLFAPFVIITFLYPMD